MTAFPRPHRIFLSVAVLAVAAAGACSLNPQPLPPEVTGGGPSEGAGDHAKADPTTADAAQSSPTTPDASGARDAGGGPPPTEAGISDGSVGGDAADAVDAPIDAIVDAAGEGG